MSAQYQAIQEAFTAMRRDGKVRHRDIAAKLDISEGELIAAHVDVPVEAGAILQATCLQVDWPEIIQALEPLGEVMALTRNASCVHEKTGIYRNASHNNHVGLVLGGAIDLRIFYREWAYGFAVSEHTDQDSPQRSLQFFDVAGVAVHKIFLKSQSNVDAFDALVKRFAANEQRAGIHPKPAMEKVPEVADAEIDIKGFRQAWAALRDTHEFFGLLKRFAVSRTQALRLAEPQFVQEVDVDSCRKMLHAAARDGVAIMAFVGNPGMIQIHSGPIERFAVMGQWANVLDAGFNLHLREDHIARSWVVKKPTVDGLVTSLELFNAEGDTIVMFFGERKPGKPELCEWRALIEGLLQESEPCAA